MICVYNKGHNQNKFSRDIFDSEINVNKKRLLVTGAVLLIKKSIYEEVGGLDERYNYGYEDIDFNLTAELEKFAKDMIKSKFEPGNLVGGGFNYIVEIEHLLKDLPDRLNSTLDKVERGELEINMNHSGLDELKDQLSISLIVSALLVGSSIAILADKGPRVWDISAIGFFGFLISAILGIYIIIKFIRTEN